VPINGLKVASKRIKVHSSRTEVHSKRMKVRGHVPWADAVKRAENSTRPALAAEESWGDQSDVRHRVFSSEQVRKNQRNGEWRLELARRAFSVGRAGTPAVSEAAFFL
jgi:hypothetical protein